MPAVGLVSVREVRPAEPGGPDHHGVGGRTVPRGRHGASAPGRRSGPRRPSGGRPRPLEDSRLVVDYLVNDVFGAAAPEKARGRTITVNDLLAAGETAIPARFGHQPLVEAAAREALGRAYYDLGRYDEAAHPVPPRRRGCGRSSWAPTTPTRSRPRLWLFTPSAPRPCSRQQAGGGRADRAAGAGGPRPRARPDHPRTLAVDDRAGPCPPDQANQALRSRSAATTQGEVAGRHHQGRGGRPDGRAPEAGRDGLCRPGPPARPGTPRYPQDAR